MWPASDKELSTPDVRSSDRSLRSTVPDALIGNLGSISPTYLRAAFTPVAPKSVRIQSSCQCLFTLLGSTSVKAVCGILMKLSPGVNFINICMCSFNARSSKRKNSIKLSVSFYALGSTCVKAVPRMLMKLSPGVNCINIFTCSFYA